MTMLKIGIIREEKTPIDSRVALAPEDAALLNKEKDIDIVVQPSAVRAFTNQEYIDAGLKVSEDMSDRDILLGVKEVPIQNLIKDKTYFFFSHTIKKQPYNRGLLQAVVSKNIRLIDYEMLVNDQNIRVIAFGRFAGMVGAHNAIWTWAQRTGEFYLPTMTYFSSYDEARRYYKSMRLTPLRIALTGAGRVAQGAAMVLNDMGIRKVTPAQYLTSMYDHPVYTQLTSFHYAVRKDGRTVEHIQDYYDHPDAYDADFIPYTSRTDIMINGIYWDAKAPAFFTREDMKDNYFEIKVIADVTCDIAPVSSIPSTLRATTIEGKVFGYDPYEEIETTPHVPHVIDMMTVDNLPNELPRDASIAFGDKFFRHVIPELRQRQSLMLDKATIAKDGDLGEYFEYLRGYLEGKE